MRRGSAVDVSSCREPGCGLGSQGLGSVLDRPGGTESASFCPAAVGPRPHARWIPGSLYWSIELEFDTGFYDQGLVQFLKLGILRARCHVAAAEWTPGQSSWSCTAHGSDVAPAGHPEGASSPFLALVCLPASSRCGWPTEEPRGVRKPAASPWLGSLSWTVFRPPVGSRELRSPRFASVGTEWCWRTL